MADKYKIASFFAGIGGFDIAFENQGFQTKFLCEINPFCLSLLERHWPQVKKATDITSIEASDIPKCDIWCGGFPCQDISVARAGAERLGLAGSRSGLFYQYAELIRKSSPEVVVIENVQGLFNSNQGRDFGVILQRMSTMGYAVAWRMLNSRYFGVPQSRTRVYMCCWKSNPQKAIDVMFDEQVAEKPTKERLDFMTEESKPNEYPKVPMVAYCLAASSGRHTGTDWSRTYVICNNGIRRLTPLESERLQGFPDYWTVPVGGAAYDEKTNTLRYTAIGNAVSVPVAEWIAKKIKRQLGHQAAFHHDGSFDISAPDFAGYKWDERNLAEIDFTDTNNKYSWLRGGLVWNGHFIQCNCAPTPMRIIKSSLLALIEKEQKENSFHLSPNAAEGILRRVDHQHRTLFPPLRKALEQLKDRK